MNSTDTDHRFALITDENQSGYLWIASILCLIYSSLVLIVRLHIKWNLYGLDDVTATLATTMQLGEVVPLFLAMQRGLGKSELFLNTSQLAEAGRAVFAAQIFLILSLALAKGSVAALMLRLFTRDIEATRKSWFLCNATVALTIAWAIGSIIAVSMSCSPSSYIGDTEGQCGSQLTRWRVVSTFDIFIELLLILLPILFIWPIQMKGHVKIQVIIAFGLRLPVIIFSAMHLHNVATYAQSTNVSQAMIPALVYQQFELFWSLLAATIPTLKSFMKSFNSGFGMEIDIDGYGSEYGPNNRSFPLESLEHKTSQNDTANSRAGARASRKSNSNSRAGRSRSRTGSSKGQIRPVARVPSNGSQEMMIQKAVQWSVHHMDARR